MYVPKKFKVSDQEELIKFMKQFSFATIITSENNLPVATHLPFSISVVEDEVILGAHFARANSQWKDFTENPVLVVFTEPHAYVSPKHYDDEVSVPTWNYYAVHAYGNAELVTDETASFQMLGEMIMSYDPEYHVQWQKLPQDYKLKMLKGIVPFQIRVNDLQASMKMSQNKTAAEQERIIKTLSESNNTTDQLVAVYMQQNLKP